MTDHMKKLYQHCFSQLRITSSQLDFLRMCVSEETTPEVLAAYYEKIEFEKLGSQHVCALAELSRRMEYRGVPSSLIPRVRGVIRYHTALNARQFQEFHHLLKQFNEHGIDVMLMKGGAMRTYYMPRVIRYMGDIDFWVKPEDFDRACELARASGEYEYFPYAHHVGLGRNGCMLEMHVSYLKENQGKTNEEIFWKESEKTVLLGEPVFIPAPEAMLLSILTNIFGDCIRGNVYGSSWVRWAADCKWLIQKNNIAWDTLCSLSAQYGVNLSVKIMLMILNDIFPGIVPDDVVADLQLTGADSQKIVWMFRMSESYFAGRKHRSDHRIAFAWFSLRHLWYKHRLMGEPGSWFSDFIHFPAYIKGLWRCNTWMQFAALLFRKIRNPNRAISTQ